jgi:hypothetical protein
MEELETTGVSRRDALKRIGAGAAVAWTAPTLLSMQAAGAGSPHPCNITMAPCGKGADCDVPATCGPTGSGCACFNVAGDIGQFCSSGEFNCGNQIVCTSSDQCPCGWGCVASCCGPGVCRPPCGEPNPASAGGGGSSSL